MDERFAVIDAAIRYARACDERDWVLLAGVFTPDVVVDYSTGNHVEGREAVVAGVRVALEGSGPSQHLLGNHDVEVDGERARSSCCVRAFSVGAPGGAFADQTYELFATYNDELVRTDDGWQVAKRRMDIAYELGERRVLFVGAT